MKTAIGFSILLLAGWASAQNPPNRLTTLEDPRQVTVMGLKPEPGTEGQKVYQSSSREPIMVADFGGERVIRRVSTTYRGPAARIDFYLFGEICKIDLINDPIRSLCADIKSIEWMFANAPEPQRKPIASVLVKRSNESVNLRRFFAPVAGRYLVITYSRQTTERGTGSGSTPVLTYLDAGISDATSPTTIDHPNIALPPFDGIPPISR